jgi:hypothetical protein
MDQKYLCELSLSYKVERVALLRQIKTRDGVWVGHESVETMMTTVTAL